jgi:2-iminobutanoate/2-iminopropanoate deaminase
MKPPHLAQTTEAGSLVFISGQLPFDAARSISDTTMGGQTTQALNNLSAILTGLGLTPNDVVKTTNWLTDASGFQAFNDSYAEFFGDHKPARSTVISQLVLPTALVEIETVAVRPNF